jgi:hypothetical protein
MKTSRINMRTCPNLYAAVRELARKEGRTPSNMAHLILERDAAVRKILTKTKTKGNKA